WWPVSTRRSIAGVSRDWSGAAEPARSLTWPVAETSWAAVSPGGRPATGRPERTARPSSSARTPAAWASSPSSTSATRSARRRSSRNEPRMARIRASSSTYQAVTRARTGSRASQQVTPLRRLEPVADAADGADADLAAGLLELAAQGADVDVDERG